MTVGFHRLLTHRSFRTRPVVRGILAALGSAAIEGPAISWVADHRKHHAFSDRPGDPHSPHVGHGGGWRASLRGLAHAHVGWLFRHDERIHNVTYSINSICHAFGRRSYATADESRNVGWLALPSLGEAWHNNHHAFPTSACHGLERRQLDPSAMVIGALERCGLAWDVVRVSPDRRSSKALGAAARGSA